MFIHDYKSFKLELLKQLQNKSFINEYELIKSCILTSYNIGAEYNFLLLDKEKMNLFNESVRLNIENAIHDIQEHTTKVKFNLE